MSMYSRCSDHCTHILIPSSKKVDTRQNRARWGRTCFEFLVTLSATSSALDRISFWPDMFPTRRTDSPLSTSNQSNRPEVPPRKDSSPKQKSSFLCWALDSPICYLSLLEVNQ